MIEYKGLFFPDGEKHLIDWLEKAGRDVQGKPAYQYNKYLKALLYGKGRRNAVDVGANIGLWSRVMAIDFKKVIAFEPVPLYRECWQKNVEFKNVELHGLALGAREGIVDMECGTPNSFGDTFVSVGKGVNVAKNVRLATLDSFELKEVDFIKVDCEGYEYHVLQGAEKTLLANRPVVIVEQKPGHASKFGLGEMDAVEYLKSLGAKLCDGIAGDYILAWIE